MSEGKEPDWERVQKKTFTKWINTHMNKRWGADAEITDVLADWEEGIPLMQLAVALFENNEKEPEKAISMPKAKPGKNKISKIGLLNQALGLFKTAGVVLRGISAENLFDHGPEVKPNILGMIFIIILDYASRATGGSSAEVKRALLEWVNKCTQGYERVNPPGVKNFTKDWRSGLAWCALIHKHRPGMIDYEKCLTQTNAENLETAFSVADEQLGIARLLDVEDCDVDLPDDKSVITYTMEYFFLFAGEGLLDSAAEQLASFLKFMRELRDRMNDYERRARLLLGWVSESTGGWDNFNFGDTVEDAQSAFDSLREFVTAQKPPQEGEKMDLETLFQEIQATLSVNNLAPYVPPEDVEPAKIEEAFGNLSNAQNAHGKAVRENRMRFIEQKDDSAADEIRKQIEQAFKHYDTTGDGLLNKDEFAAACMEMQVVVGGPDKQAELFAKIADGDDSINFEEFKRWMEPRLVTSIKDSGSLTGVIGQLSDGKDSITDDQLARWFKPEDVEFMKNNGMSQNDDGTWNYGAFVGQIF